MNEHEEKTKFLPVYEKIAEELTSRGYNAEAYLEESAQFSYNAWDVGIRLTDEESQWDPHVDIEVVWEQSKAQWEMRQTNDIRVITRTIHLSKTSYPQHINGSHDYRRIVDAWLLTRSDRIARMTAEETRRMNESTVRAVKRDLDIDGLKGREGFDVQASVYADKPCKITYNTVTYGTVEDAEDAMRRLTEAGFISS